MKRLTTQILFAAAALTAVAVNAPAQMLKAEVPFTFHAGQNLMGPGAYSVQRASGSHHVILRNADSGKVAMVVTASDITPTRQWARDGRARLRFECAGGRCILRQVWYGGGVRGANLPGPDFGRGEAVQSTEIHLTKVNVN
jgi:hypothetical protein